MHSPGTWGTANFSDPISGVSEPAAKKAYRQLLGVGDEYDEEAEEQDLGDARIVISGPFEAPAEWDAKDRDDYFDGTAPEAFVVARIAPGM